MIIRSSEAKQKERGPMVIKEYSINPDFSAALIDINGSHGKIRCVREDRIYFIIDGKGKFVLDEKEHPVSGNDLVSVPKNTPYNIIGRLKYFLVCSPEFNPEDDIFLK